MATTRTAHTVWTGDLADGQGTVSMDSSGIGSYHVSWPSRAEEPNGRTSPEELIAAAHSSCFSMALAAALSKAGTPPTGLETRAEVTLTPGTGITAVHLTVSGQVDGVDEGAFRTLAEEAGRNCPVSQALSGVPITLAASLS